MVKKALKKVMRIIRISLSLKQAENVDAYIFIVCISVGNYQKELLIPISGVKSLIVGYVMNSGVYGPMAIALLLLFVFLVWIIMPVWVGVGL